MTRLQRSGRRGHRRESASPATTCRNTADERPKARRPRIRNRFAQPRRRRRASSSLPARPGSRSPRGRPRRRRGWRRGRRFPRRCNRGAGTRARTRRRRTGRRPTVPRSGHRREGPCTRRRRRRSRRRQGLRAGQRRATREGMARHQSGLRVHATESPDAIRSKTAPAPANAAVTSRASRFLPESTTEIPIDLVESFSRWSRREPAAGDGGNLRAASLRRVQPSRAP